MRSSISVSCLLTAATLALAAPATAACEPDGDVQFICGPVSPEDLVAVPGTPWIFVSSMEAEGRIYRIDTRDRAVEVAYPVAGVRHRHHREAFGACPGLVEESFRPHGLSLRPAGTVAPDIHTLYVVRHGAREAVEVFEVDARGDKPELTWIGCAVAPEGVGLNSVAYLPDGHFAATNFQMTGGEVWEWGPGEGWSRVPGSETAGPNGLESSPDGAWLYIGGWGTRSLIRLSRGRTPVERDVVEVGFHVDNVRRNPDGSLLAAGHIGPTPAAIGSCLQARRCDGVTTRVARVDPDALEVEDLWSYPSNEHLILGTVALDVGAEVWVGQVGGGDRIARFAAAE